jgi:hypothetical protein
MPFALINISSTKKKFVKKFIVHSPFERGALGKIIRSKFEFLSLVSSWLVDDEGF